MPVSIPKAGKQPLALVAAFPRTWGFYGLQGAENGNDAPHNLGLVTLDG